jgi:hypothetical protein
MPLEPTTKETINKTSIMNWVEKTFNIPIKGKVTNKWKAAGMYYPKKWLVRLEKWGELPVMVHEVAHHIDLGLLKKQYPEGWRKGERAMTTELADLDYDQKKRRTKEGFAEFMRYKMTSDLAPQKAPIFNKFFEEFLKKNPKLDAQLKEFRSQLDIWAGQGAENRVIQHIDWKGEHTSVFGIKNKIKKAIKFINEKFNDEFYVPQKITADIEKVLDRELRPSKNPAKMAEFSKSKAGAIAHTFITKKAIDEQGNVIGKSLKEILKPIKRKEIRQFISYAVSKRVLNLEGRKIESGFDIKDAKFIIDKYKNETWDNVAQEISDWAGQLMDWVTRAGGLDDASAKKIKDANPIYLMFKRAFLDEAEVIKQGTGGYVDTGSGFKRIKGSGRPIINPIEAMMSQASALIAKAQKIRIASLWVDLAKQNNLGGFITEVPAPTNVISFDSAQLRKYMEDMTGEEWANEGDLVTVFTQGKRYTGKDNVVTIFKDGKLKFYEIHPDLYNSFKAVDPLKLGPISKLLAPFSRLLRLGATGLKVSFGIARNPFRDALSYVVFSKRNGVTVFDPIKGVYTNLTAKEGSPTWRFKALGGALSGQIGLDRASTRSAYDEILLGNLEKIGKPLLIAKHPIDTLRDIISVTEIGPRSVEMEKNYELYNSEAWKEKHPDWTEEDAFIQAFLDAQDVTVNFTKSGKWARQLNEVSAFFNVAIRGPEKLFRTFKERPVSSTIKALLWLTSIALVSWWRNKDKEWYKNLEPAYKYNNLFFDIPGLGIIRLPIPFELGTMFMAMPQAVMDTFKNKDTQAIEGIIKILKTQIPNPIPSAFGPLLDVATNKNYLGSPIESGGMKYKYPTERYYDYTTSLAKNLSKVFDKIGMELSPIQIDYLVDAYTGGFLRQFKSGKELYDLPVLSDLMLRDPLYPKRQLNQFFKDYTVLGQKVQSDIATDEEYDKYKDAVRFYEAYKNIQVDIVEAKANDDSEGVDQFYREITEELEFYGYN